MDIRQEYKKCAEIMNPSAEAMERMKRNILAKAAQPEKKAFPFKKLAYAGSALAACAVIAVAAANILPSMKAKNDMAQEELHSEAAVYAVADYDKTAGSEAKSAAQDAADCADVAASENTVVIQTTTAVTTYDSLAEYITDAIFDSNTEAAEEYTYADAPYEDDLEAEAAADEDCFADATTNSPLIVTLEMDESKDHCIIGGTMFVLVPPDILTQFILPEALTTTEYPSPDGRVRYTVLDHGDVISVLCDGEQLGTYCRPEMLDALTD